MAAKLVAEEGLLKGLVLSFEEGDQWVIGRDPDACQLLIEDPAASRKHMICRTTPQGILVENLSTTNPVLVNDVELKEPTLLQNGDALKIGGGMFRFYAEAAANAFKDTNIDAKNEVHPVVNGASSQASEEEHEEQHQEEKEEHLQDKEQPQEIEQPNVESNAESEGEPNKEQLDNDLPLADEEAVNEIAENNEVDNNQAGKLEFDKNEIENNKVENNEINDEPDVHADANVNQPASPEPIQTENEPLSNVTPLIDEHADDEEVDLPHDSIFNEEPSEKNEIAEVNFGLIETGRWLLKVISGPNNGAEFSMAADSSYVIGTDPNTCDLVFHDTSVSRQHARISIESDDILTIEDLKSRNGTIIDGEPLQGKQSLAVNTVVSMGTTSFVIFDREGEMQTIISPLLPSIVKVLQKEVPESSTPTSALTPTAQTETLQTESIESAASTPIPEVKEPVHPTSTIGAFILIGILTGLFVIVGIGTTTLFRSEPVVAKEQVDPTKLLDEALAPFSPGVKYTFNKGTGRLLLVGHVLTSTDKNQLLYTLQGMNFIKNLDDSGIIIDEYVWQEVNQVLDKNNWKGITVQSPSAGHFVISGYLQTRAQAARLDDYITNNFPYPDLLEKRIVVDEDITSAVNNLVENMGFKNIKVKLDNGEITLSGKIPVGKSADIDALLAEVRNISGVRNVRNLMTEVAPEQSMVNISDKYEVTGLSNQGGTLNVVINGRILMKGDVLDGMTITSIQSNTILLEKDGIKYRIDFSK